MDPSQIYTLSPQYFFQESTYQNKLMINPIEMDDSIFWKENLIDNEQELINNRQKNSQMIEIDNHNNISFIQFTQLKRENTYSDQFESFLDYNIQNIHPNIYQSLDKTLQQINQQSDLQIQLNTIKSQSCQNSNLTVDQLENIIAYLVQYSNNSIQDLKQNIDILYPQSTQIEIIKILIQKFNKLKKTKQQLVKYCMRKAFKFILELPKNTHYLTKSKQQKYSYSKCKNKYLKNLSDQKSMNNTFLKQLFKENDFTEDYKLFLYDFQNIMINDNQKKIKNLATLLTQEKQGLYKKAEFVKRLPWTKGILQKVLKISHDLLKFSQG